MVDLLPTYTDVVDAANRIEKLVVRTPLLTNATLDKMTGASVFVKPECLQATGSFKLRGASNAIARLSQEQRKLGVVACSSGNHAQGIAEAARRVGIAATIVMPADAPAIKVERTKRSGAVVVPYDREFEDRDAIANALCEKSGATFIHPFNHPDVIAGQGTSGLEIAHDIEAVGQKLDRMIICCGGGGLSAGTALALLHHFPDVKLHTAEPEHFDDYARSLAEGERVSNTARGGSICDAIVTDTPGERSFEIAKETFANGFVVSEEQVRDSVRFAYNELKLVVEPGGAVALAALLAAGKKFEGETIAIVLSGGNADPKLFADIIAQ